MLPVLHGANGLSIKESMWALRSDSFEKDSSECQLSKHGQTEMDRLLESLSLFDSPTGSEVFVWVIHVFCDKGFLGTCLPH